MADFKLSIQKTLAHEGGFQNSVFDWANWEGGKEVRDQYLATKNPDLIIHLKGTKFGITAQDMPGVSIKDITVEQAIEYYREHYWKPLYSEINNQLIADKLFDIGVLFGVGTAVRLLQITMAQKMSVVSDGVFGPSTLTDVNQEEPDLLPRYKTVLLQHCINIVNHNPLEQADMHGWIARINS